jgi:lipoprotein-releasing system permease protein
LFYFWVLSKYTASWRRFFDIPIILTIAGISIGVAVLVVAMSSFSGFETTLKKAVIEVVSDVSIFKRGGKIDRPEALKKEIGSYMNEVSESMMFVLQESLVSGRGKISAVLLHGIEKEKAGTVLNLKNHIVAGKLRWEDQQGQSPAFMGKDLAAKMGIKPGDVFKIILPKSGKNNSADITPIIHSFYLAAAVDLGKYEFNSRFVFVDLPVVQEILGSQKISGLRIKLKDSEHAEAWARAVQEKIGWTYAAVDWKQTSRNLFSAIEYEKKVMFFVVLIIIIASCFNVAAALFVTVLKRYRDISLMKTLGARPVDIVILFCLHGLFLGVTGLTIGISLGIFFSFLFEFLQRVFPLLPADIYKLSFVATEVRLGDLAMICGATMLICFLSTLIPSIRGAMLKPVEGLKYE